MPEARGREEEMEAKKGDWGALEKLQLKILERITKLEVHLPPADPTESRLSSILRANGVSDFIFSTVPFDYYERSLESRRAILGAPSIHHLCKSIVLVNTQAHQSVTDCSDPNNSKYYVVVVQYSARFSAETVKNFLYNLNHGTIPKKRFNLRLAPEEESLKLTGYKHNGVTCIGMNTNIPGYICNMAHGWSCNNPEVGRLFCSWTDHKSLGRRINPMAAEEVGVAASNVIGII